VRSVGIGIGMGMIFAGFWTMDFAAARGGMVFFSGQWHGNDACTVAVGVSMEVVELTTWCV
jgi:hypothetical protein